jgi:hypothetical protein
MTRYEWTPASEPPDSARKIIAWVKTPNGVGRWFVCRYHAAEDLWDRHFITQWRDIPAPDFAGFDFGNLAVGD